MVRNLELYVQLDIISKFYAGNGIIGFMFSKDYSDFPMEGILERDLGGCRKTKKEGTLIIWERNTGDWVYNESNILLKNGVITLEVDLLTVYILRETER